jgi:hypothetical protein
MLDVEARLLALLRRQGCSHREQAGHHPEF